MQFVKKIFFGLFIVCFFLNYLSLGVVKAQTNGVFYEKAKVESAEDITKSDSENQDNKFNDWQKIKVKFLTGDKKGTEAEFENPASSLKKNDRRLQVGNTVVVSYQTIDNQLKVALVDFDRSNSLIFLVVICVVLVLIIGRWKGVKALVSFAWIALVLIGFFIPKLMSGSNVYLMTFLTAIMIVIGVGLLLLGFKKRTLLVILSSLFGLTVATILTLLVGRWSNFSPVGEEATVLFTLSPILSKLDLGAIIYASIVIGAIGSMMDMTLSIVAGVEELLESNREKGARKITQEELFRSGLNIGQSVMAAETNTMILAYFGSALTIWMIAISQQYQWNMLINFSMIFGELLRILAGAAGIFSSIPMTAFLASIFLSFNRKYAFEK